MDELRINKIEDVFRVKLPSEFKSYIIATPNAAAINELTWSSDPALIRDELTRKYKQSLRFDIEENNYWPAVFGERPNLIDERVDKAMECISKLPPLLPIDGLRKLIPTSITDADRKVPILSFHGFTDTIYMYANLDDFLNDKPVSDDDRQLLPRVVGWDKVFDGLGADDDELYSKDE